MSGRNIVFVIKFLQLHVQTVTKSFTCFLQDSTKEEKAEDVKELASVIAKASDGCEDIVFNPNVFTEFKLAGSPEVFLPLLLPFFYI